MGKGRITPLVFLAGLLISATGVLAADRRVALVIGNSSYRSVPVLANPIHDAFAVAEMLRKVGFDSVDLRQDLGMVELKRAMREFVLTARNADIAVVFFAGHGIEVAGINYLIPIDARLKSDFDAEDEGLSLERVVRVIEPARRLRLIILDACRNNPFNAAMQRTVSLRAVANGLAKIEPTVSNTLIAFAARAGSVAEDGAGDHSPFTSALLKNLTVPGLDLRVAFGRIRDEVLANTGGKQEPFVYGSLGGATMALVPDDQEIAQGDGSAVTLRIARRDYEFAERVGTKEAFGSFLATHPRGFYADLARAQLAKLTGNVGVALSSPPEPARLPLPLTRPATQDPTTAAVAPGPAALLPTAGPTNACRRDTETLARLRVSRVLSDLLRFQRELVCEELRPQLTRLIEAADGAEHPKLVPESVPPRAADPTITARVIPSNCDREAQLLARLRNTRDVQAINRLSRDLSCNDLRPQVMRLRESVGDE